MTASPLPSTAAAGHHRRRTDRAGRRRPRPLARPPDAGPGGRQPRRAPSVREWGHVRLFSPWSELVDPAAERLLARTGGSARPRQLPDRRRLGRRSTCTAGRGPGRHRRWSRSASGTGSSAWPSRAATAWWTPVARRRRSPCTSRPLGRTRIVAAAVIDASGTWTAPNPLGADGLPALGEAEHADRISYGIPDFTDPRSRALRGQARRGRRHRRLRPEHPRRAGRPRRRGARHQGGLAGAAARHR